MWAFIARACDVPGDQPSTLLALAVSRIDFWRSLTSPILVATSASRRGLLVGPCSPVAAITLRPVLGSSRSSGLYTPCTVAVAASTARSGPVRRRPCIGLAIADKGATPPADIPVGPPFFRFSVDEQFATLLETCGLTGVEVNTIAFDHAVPTTDELWDGLLAGTVRISALILSQPEKTRRRIRAAFDRLVPDTSAVISSSFRCPSS